MKLFELISGNLLIQLLIGAAGVSLFTAVFFLLYAQIKSSETISMARLGYTQQPAVGSGQMIWVKQHVPVGQLSYERKEVGQ